MKYQFTEDNNNPVLTICSFEEFNKLNNVDIIKLFSLIDLIEDLALKKNYTLAMINGRLNVATDKELNASMAEVDRLNNLIDAYKKDYAALYDKVKRAYSITDEPQNFKNAFNIDSVSWNYECSNPYQRTKYIYKCKI